MTRVGSLEEEHRPEAVRARLNARPSGRYLRDLIYGAVDGAVTTFAVVAGVAGANLRASIVIVLGIANLIADGFSMAVSNYLGLRSERQQAALARRMEEQHVKEVPEGEREEVRQIFASKGFEGETLERAVEVITSDTGRWIDTMMAEELQIPPHPVDPIRAGAATFAAFVVVGFLPLSAFVYELLSPGSLEDPFLWSALMTAVAFFLVGAAKSPFAGERWWKAGLETLAIGGGTAGLAYLIGNLLEGLI